MILIAVPPFDVKAAAERQRLYCQLNNLPLFAPRTGICWRCGANIYYPMDEDESSAYTVTQAGNRHITYCPRCNNSFCD